MVNVGIGWMNDFLWPCKEKFWKSIRRSYLSELVCGHYSDIHNYWYRFENFSFLCFSVRWIARHKNAHESHQEISFLLIVWFVNWILINFKGQYRNFPTFSTGQSLLSYSNPSLLKSILSLLITGVFNEVIPMTRNRLKKEQFLFLLIHGNKQKRFNGSTSVLNELEYTGSHQIWFTTRKWRRIPDGYGC